MVTRAVNVTDKPTPIAAEPMPKAISDPPNAATAADDAVRKEYGDSYQNLKQRYFGSCFANETVM